MLLLENSQYQTKVHIKAGFQIAHLVEKKKNKKRSSAALYLYVALLLDSAAT